MKAKTIFRKALTAITTGSATLALGFFAYAGMFVINPSIFLCFVAFGLGVAFEAQIYGESVSGALRRIFTGSYLKLGIVRRFLDEKIEDEKKKLKAEEKQAEVKTQQKQTEEERKAQEERIVNKINNHFLKAYLKQKKSLKLLEESEEPHEAPERKAHKKRIAQAKNRLRRMELFFLKILENRNTETTSLMEVSANALINNEERVSLNKEIKKKARLIRVGWIFAVGGGIGSGLATLSAIKLGVAAFAITSAIPGGILIAIAACAAVGYTLMLYQAFSDMVEEFTKKKWKEYFSRRLDPDNSNNDESKILYGLRIGFTLIAFGLAIFATIATAGTWWTASKHGASIIGIGTKVAAVLRTAAIALMTIPSFVFSGFNASQTIDKIREGFPNLIKNVKEAWAQVVETKNDENIVQFINPFRLAEKLISSTLNSILFIGHLASMGLASDTVPGVSPTTCAVATSVEEGLADVPYLMGNDDGHNHESRLVAIVTFPIKLFSVAWNYVSSSDSLSASYKKVFPDHNHPVVSVPPVSHHWRNQELFEAFERTSTKLATDSKELAAIKTVKDKLREAMNESRDSSSTNNNELPKTLLKKDEFESLSNHKNSLWYKPLDKAIRRYLSYDAPVQIHSQSHNHNHNHGHSHSPHH